MTKRREKRQRVRYNIHMEPVLLDQNIKLNQEIKIATLLKWVNTILIVFRTIQGVFFYTIPSIKMCTVTIFSILLYLSGFYFVKKRHFIQYVHAVFLENIASISAGVIFLGWATGYQLWCFSLSSIFFLPLFIDTEDSNKIAPFIPLMAVITFFFLYYFCHTGLITQYDLEQDSLTSKVLFIINAFTSLSVIFTFTYLFAIHAKNMQTKLKTQAEYDQLTNLYNRYTMHKIIDNAIQLAMSGKSSFSIAISDIDFFKKINDTYGHNAGDTVLSKLSQLFLKYKSKGIEIGRWGGEEFVFICKDTYNTDKLYTIMENIRKEVENFNVKTDKITLHFTISSGIAQFSVNQSFNDIIQSADNKLYLAKQNGRNQTLR